MATDAQSLLTAGKCFVCAGATPADIAELSLLAQISQVVNPSMATDAESLMAQGKCFVCLPSATPTQIIRLALLVNIATGIQAGGGGGGGTVFGNYAGGQPNFTPASGTGVAVDTSDGTEWFYYNGKWQ